MTKKFIKKFKTQCDPLINLKTIQAIGSQIIDEWNRDPESWKAVFRMAHFFPVIQTTEKGIEFINQLWGALLNQLKQKKIEMTSDSKIIPLTDVTDYTEGLLWFFVHQYDSVLNIKTHNRNATRLWTEIGKDPEFWKKICREQQDHLGLNTSEEDCELIFELWITIFHYFAKKEENETKGKRKGKTK